MGSNQKVIAGILIIILLGSLIAAFVVCNKKSEGFPSGYGMEMPGTETPTFLNLGKGLGIDPNLAAKIQELKFLKRHPTKSDGHGGFISGAMNPVIIIPGLGASEIWGVWDRPEGKKVKSLSANGKFEEQEKWSCKSSQQNWAKLWFSKEELMNPMAQYCWLDNIRVQPTKDGIKNSNGVDTTIREWPSVRGIENLLTLMRPLIEAFQALGYQDNVNLFAACYDFRLIASPDVMNEWCLRIKGLIEQSYESNAQLPVFLVSHSLGCQLTNIFLSRQAPEWKSKYVNTTIYISPNFIGSPKPLRTFLSGDDVNIPKATVERPVFRSAIRNFSGLLMSLPIPAKDCPTEHKDGLWDMNIPLLNFRNVDYGACCYEELMKLTGADDSWEIYSKFVQPLQIEALNPPGCKVEVIIGAEVPTENFYKYTESLMDAPMPVKPPYALQMPYGNNYDYPRAFSGDGTCPAFVLQYPNKWNFPREGQSVSWNTEASGKTENCPVTIHSYTNMEHTRILSHAGPVTDILNLISGV